ncbi:DNA mismatch repair endonuclease MutL [Flavobacteriaceae bacterium]|nr:DNA mismatch repair endonuclease MutL [Flavobacteriaceae bacterium]MDC3238378.1 DNA mismatch repair endonuclease MutL [Flavobacteriaceae bacterium]
MADIISLLPDHVANQIAAGEVIQRPASVVKELLENAIDAKATDIQLLINGAGKTMIQVIDNGIGMSTTDVRLAFDRHATSKIKSAEDLFSITSKGFRGEALASIVAIAQVEVHTKRAEDEIATCLKISGSKVEDQEVSVAPTGTSIAVKNLFYNVPARRNFLKSDKVELRHIIDEFHRVALTHPEVRFTFLQNGTELFDLPAANFRKRIANIFGNKIEEKLIPVEEMTTVAGIEGFIVKPEFAKKSRGQQFFFVNKRFIKSPFLNHAVSSAFQGLLRDQFHPGYFIYIQIDPKTIDINIHPTKTEIKFEEEQNLYAIIKSMVKHSLGMFQAAPVLDFERDPNLDTPYDFKQKLPSNTPSIEVDSSFNPFKDSHKGIPKASKSNWESLYSGLEMPNDNSADEELKLAIEQTPKVFQLLRKFIVTTTRSGLLVIDQQRAHQRVLYEKFLSSITKRDMVSQQLIFPKEIELTQQQIALFGELEANLNAMGFVVKQHDNLLHITGIPAICDDKQLGQLFEDIFSPPDDQEQVVSFSQLDYMAKILSKSLSIKGNLTLTVEEQQALVDDFFACKDTLTSPFNRKIFITLDKEELEKKLD